MQFLCTVSAVVHHQCDDIKGLVNAEWKDPERGLDCQLRHEANSYRCSDLGGHCNRAHPVLTFQHPERCCPDGSKVCCVPEKEECNDWAVSNVSRTTHHSAD